LNVLWKRLFVLLVGILALCLIVLAIGNEYRGGILVFLIGNIGGYVGFHKSLGGLKDGEIIDLATSWWSIIAPSFIGGVLAMVLYILFLSGIISGELFPRFKPESTAAQGVLSLLDQKADDLHSYAKLFFWSFVGGFNQKHVVDIIESVKAK